MAIFSLFFGLQLLQFCLELRQHNFFMNFKRGKSKRFFCGNISHHFLSLEVILMIFGRHYSFLFGKCARHDGSTQVSITQMSSFWRRARTLSLMQILWIYGGGSIFSLRGIIIIAKRQMETYQVGMWRTKSCEMFFSGRLSFVIVACTDAQSDNANTACICPSRNT